MRVRYDTWIEGLNADWLVSRQRYFGVPFPVWYRVDADGKPMLRRSDCCRPTTRLPVDPSTDCPPGFTEEQRDQPGGFTADPDVMDTWATSSLTPQIATGWVDDPDLFERTFPMDLRPQGPEIIRTWLFDTVVRARLEHGALPWTDTHDQRVGARSRPQEDVEVEGQRRHADAARRGVRRRRAALLGVQRPARRRHRGRLRHHEGRSQARDQDAQRVEVRARRLRRRGRGRDARSRPRSTVRCSSRSPSSSTTRPTAFDAFDYARSLERTERFFWSFCDDYVELVKSRAYGEAATTRRSARPRSRCASRSRRCCDCSRRSSPYVTEEVWSWWRDGLDPPRRVAGRERRSGSTAATRSCTRSRPTCSPRCARRSRRRRCSLATPVARGRACTTRRSGSPRSTPRAPTCATRARSRELETEVGAVLSVRGRAARSPSRERSRELRRAGLAERARQPGEPQRPGREPARARPRSSGSRR